MKTIKDIEFKPHSVGDGLAGKIFFDNGYGVSVVRFKIYDRYSSYTNNENEWEISYNTPITNDVMGYLSSDEVTNIMKQVQEL